MEIWNDLALVNISSEKLGLGVNCLELLDNDEINAALKELVLVRRVLPKMIFKVAPIRVMLGKAWAPREKLDVQELSALRLLLEVKTLDPTLLSSQGVESVQKYPLWIKRGLARSQIKMKSTKGPEELFMTWFTAW